MALLVYWRVYIRILFGTPNDYSYICTLLVEVAIAWHATQLIFSLWIIGINPPKTKDVRAHKGSHVGPQLLVHLQDPKVYSITFSGSHYGPLVALVGLKTPLYLGVSRILGKQLEFCHKKGSPNVAPLNSSNSVRYKPRIRRGQGNSTREISHFPPPQCEITTRKFPWFLFAVQ